jgi:acyl-homoserine lactone acylase PvdQ
VFHDRFFYELKARLEAFLKSLSETTTQTTLDLRKFLNPNETDFFNSFIDYLITNYSNTIDTTITKETVDTLEKELLNADMEETEKAILEADFEGFDFDGKG